MIAPSEFNALSAAGLEPITLVLQERFNGENAQPAYYFRRFLTPRYSLDGTWQAITLNNGLIVADVVALDSSLPLKTRPSMSKVSGELPKIGTERGLNESELRQLQLLQRAGSDAVLVSRLFFQDVRAVYGGVLEQWEAMTLQGLSSGEILVNEDTNVGTGIRVNFGYPTDNLFNPTVVWGGAGYKPISDLIRVAEKAREVDGNSLTRFLMNRAQLNQILASDEAKNLFANSQGIASVSFQPTTDQINAALQTNYGFELEVITRSVVYEKNGVKQTINPWKAGQIVGLTDDNVGSLVYTDLAEATNPVAGVNYSTVENSIMIKQYRLVRPSLKQVTASESMSLPVISEVERIYKLDVLVAAV